MRMKLTDAEQAMLDGASGKAKQKAMDLLVRYGEALGAERLVETKNVAGTWNSASKAMLPFAEKSLDAVFSKFNLDSDEVVETPQAEVYTCQLIHGIDTRHAEITGVPEAQAEAQRKAERYFGERGVAMFNTCTPYQVGNVPVRGEHCAWMESSAVVYCNSVLGARTNTEGRESTGAASITGRIPYWGYHLPENRFGTHLVEVEVDVDDMMGWGLMGYAVGEMVEEDIPVLDGIRKVPSMIMLKHFGAASASSGGVELFHVPGVTPEAHDLAAAFGGRKPHATLKYGTAERKAAYDNLNSSAKDDHVDFIMLGCPHSSIEQVWTAAKLLNGKKLHENTQLWLFTPRALKDTADLNGYTKMIEDAGGHVLSDTCPAIGRVMPKGTTVVATDSAKQAHYLPAIMNVQTWFGSVEDCVNAALTGRWSGELK
jgi:predicted aconitase